MTTMPCDRRYFVHLAAIGVWAVSMTPIPVRAASMSPTEFAALAARCAPSGPMTTLAAVARTESDSDPWALHDNTTNVSIRPDSFTVALADAKQLINGGDSVDVGLMQINSENLSSLDIDVANALDACDSLAGGAAILKAAYGNENTEPDQQVALLLALSRYNTGTPFKGIMNGYARTVIANGPASAVSSTAPDIASTAKPVDPNAPPAWAVWANATYAQTHGAAWMVSVSANTVGSAGTRTTQTPHPQPASMLVFAAPNASTQTTTSTTPTTKQPRRSP